MHGWHGCACAPAVHGWHRCACTPALHPRRSPSSGSGSPHMSIARPTLTPQPYFPCLHLSIWPRAPLQVHATLAALGAPSRLHQGLNAHQAKHVAAARYDATGGLPADVRAISLYLSPDRCAPAFCCTCCPAGACTFLLHVSLGRCTPVPLCTCQSSTCAFFSAVPSPFPFLNCTHIQSPAGPSPHSVPCRALRDGCGAHACTLP